MHSAYLAYELHAMLDGKPYKTAKQISWVDIEQQYTDMFGYQRILIPKDKRFSYHTII